MGIFLRGWGTEDGSSQFPSLDVNLLSNVWPKSFWAAKTYFTILVKNGLFDQDFWTKKREKWGGGKVRSKIFVEIFYHNDHHNACPNHNCALAGRTGATSFDRREPALWVSAKHCFHGGALSWWRWSFTMSLTTYSSKAQCPNCCQNFHFEQWLFDTIFIIVR